MQKIFVSNARLNHPLQPTRMRQARILAQYPQLGRIFRRESDCDRLLTNRTWLAACVWAFAAVGWFHLRWRLGLLRSDMVCRMYSRLSW
jgi:hypothetical protein